MLQKYGCSLICIDSTHKTNKYSFLLYTLSVLDAFGKGYPVAHMITNRAESYGIVKLFFEKIRSISVMQQTP